MEGKKLICFTSKEDLIYDLKSLYYRKRIRPCLMMETRSQAIVHEHFIMSQKLVVNMKWDEPEYQVGGG